MQPFVSYSTGAEMEKITQTGKSCSDGRCRTGEGRKGGGGAGLVAPGLRVVGAPQPQVLLQALQPHGPPAQGRRRRLSAQTATGCRRVPRA